MSTSKPSNPRRIAHDRAMPTATATTDAKTTTPRQLPNTASDDQRTTKSRSRVLRRNCIVGTSFRELLAPGYCFSLSVFVCAHLWPLPCPLGQEIAVFNSSRQSCIEPVGVVEDVAAVGVIDLQFETAWRREYRRKPAAARSPPRTMGLAKRSWPSTSTRKIDAAPAGGRVVDGDQGLENDGEDLEIWRFGDLEIEEFGDFGIWGFRDLGTLNLEPLTLDLPPPSPPAPLPSGRGEML